MFFAILDLNIPPPLLSFPGVGKSSLLLRFADNTFSGECGEGQFWCPFSKEFILGAPEGF